MEENYDFDKADKETKYEVVVGRHRLAAFKQLLDEGKISKLKGLEDEKVMCWIMKKRPGLVEAAHLKANKIAAEIRPTMSKIQIILAGQAMKTTGMNLVKVKEVIQRYSKLASIHNDDINMMIKIFDYKEEVSEKVVTMLKKFEDFQTKDASNDKRKAAKMIKGEKKQMSRELFRNMNKISENLVDTVAEKVLSETMSLKDALSEAVLKEECQDVIRKIALIMFKTTESVLSSHGHLLTYEVLESFKGAKLGKDLNDRGRALRYWIQQLQKGEELSVFQPVKVFDSSTDLANLELKDTVVITASREDEEEQWKLVLEKALIKKPWTRILFVSEDKYLIREAEDMMGVKGRKNIKDIFFLSEKPFHERGMKNNMLYALLSGHIQNGPILSCPGLYRSGVSLILEDISTDGDHVSFINLSKRVPAVVVKKQFVQYVIRKEERKGIELELMKKIHPVEEDEDEIKEETVAVAGSAKKKMKIDENLNECGCSTTKYWCERCCLNCCSMCAQYDGEPGERGHGDVRNHVMGDSRCIAV